MCLTQHLDINIGMYRENPHHYVLTDLNLGTTWERYIGPFWFPGLL